MHAKIKVLPVIVRSPPTDSLKEASYVLYRWATFTEPYRVKDLDDWRRIPEKVGDVDVVMLFGGFWSVPDPLKAIDKPIVVWSWTHEGTLTMWLWETLSWLRANGIDVPVFINVEHLREYFRALAAYKSIKGCKVLLVLAGNLWFTWGYPGVREALSRRLGLRFVEKDRRYLEEILKDISDEDARNLLEQKGFTCRGVDSEDVLEAFKLYLALKKVLEEEGYSGVGVDCLLKPFYSKAGKPIHPCLAFSLLSDEGIACGCEGDVLSIATMLLLNRFFDEPCFMTNVYPLSIGPVVAKHLGIPVHEFDPKRTILLCHCAYLGVVPPSLATKFHLTEKWDKMHKGGIMVDVEVPLGSVTAARLSPIADSLQVFSGRLERILRFSSIHCRAVGVVEVDDSVKIAERIYSHHMIILPGDRREELKMLSKACGLKYEEL